MLNAKAVTGGRDAAKVLAVSWKRLEFEFEQRWSVALAGLGGSGLKVHMDMSETTVENGRGDWYFLVLLDTLAAFMAQRDLSSVECERRQFNQYAALLEAVTVAVSESFVARCCRDLDFFPAEIELVEVPLHWQSMERLGERILAGEVVGGSSTYKNRLRVFNKLKSLEGVSGKELLQILVAGVSAIYGAHFQASGSAGFGAAAPSRAQRSADQDRPREEPGIHSLCGELASLAKAKAEALKTQSKFAPRGGTLKRCVVADPALQPPPISTSSSSSSSSS